MIYYMGDHDYNSLFLFSFFVTQSMYTLGQRKLRNKCITVQTSCLRRICAESKPFVQYVLIQSTKVLDSTINTRHTMYHVYSYW